MISKLQMPQYPEYLGCFEGKSRVSTSYNNSYDMECGVTPLANRLIWTETIFDVNQTADNSRDFL